MKKQDEEKDKKVRLGRAAARFGLAAEGEVMVSVAFPFFLGRCIMLAHPALMESSGARAC